jgi:hypothetical protein
VRLGRNAIVAIGVAVAAIAVGAVLVSTFAQPAAKTEVGMVVFVDSVSLTDVRRFAIRTADGRTVEFTVGVLENGAQFPPGHLGEHEATAVPVRVTYRDENGEHVAVRLEDAVLPSPT